MIRRAGSASSSKNQPYTSTQSENRLPLENFASTKRKSCTLGLQNASKEFDFNPHEYIETQKFTIKSKTVQKGLECLKLKKHDEALLLFEGKLNLFPTNTNLLLLVGYTFTKIGNLEKGLETISKVVESNPNNFEACLFQIQILVRLKKFDKALKAASLGEKEFKLNECFQKKLDIMIRKISEIQGVKKFKTVSKEFLNLWSTKLPLELVVEILSYLNISEICRLTQVCLVWRLSLLNNTLLWTEMKLNYGLSFNLCDSIKRFDKKIFAEATTISFLNRGGPNLRVLSVKNTPSMGSRWLQLLVENKRPNLKQLHLIDSSFSPLVLNKLIDSYRLTLTHLTLSGCKVEPQIVQKALINCRTLMHLDISNNDLDDSCFFLPFSIKPVGIFKNIKFINLSTLPLSSTFIAMLHLLFPNLEGYSLCHIPNFNVNDLLFLRSSYQNLSHIELANLKSQFANRDQVLPILHIYSSKNPCIKILNLSHNMFVHDQVIYLFKHSFETLSQLDVSYTQISGNGIKLIAKKCHHLKKLSIGSCGRLGDTDLLPLTLATNKMFFSLSELSLSSLNFTSATLFSILHLPSLTKIDLSSCPKVSDDGLNFLFDSNAPKNLIYLDLKNVRLVSTGIISQLRVLLFGRGGEICHSYPY